VLAVVEPKAALEKKLPTYKAALAVSLDVSADRPTLNVVPAK
jgi:hypothetical protein